jgi:hypothetical protein
MEMPELGIKHLGIGVVAFILVFAIVTTQTQVAGVWSTGDMGMGDASCEVTLGVVGMANGQEVTTTIYNSPLYLGGVEVDSVKFTISIIATGENVDWSTLKVSFTITSEGYQASGLISWTISDFTSQSDGSYKATDEFIVDEFIADLPTTDPDETLSDGIDVYVLNVAAQVDGEIKDLKDNTLLATVTVTADYEMRTAPDGTFSLKVG